MTIEIIRYLGALFLVLALIGAAGLAARRWGVPGVTKAVDHKRLAVVETLMIGPRQRLFIVRRDNVEHLLFSGPDGVCLVENIPPSGLRTASVAAAFGSSEHEPHPSISASRTGEADL
jgi:flagellar protein FliO/FliZ